VWNDGDHVKKWIAVLLMAFAGITLGSQARARDQINSQSRAYKKSACKAQKEMARYNKQQEKAMRKSAKAQRKALKRTQHRNHL
jgi:hypothetical protein